MSLYLHYQNHKGDVLLTNNWTYGCFSMPVLKFNYKMNIKLFLLACGIATLASCSDELGILSTHDSESRINHVSTTRSMVGNDSLPISLEVTPEQRAFITKAEMFRSRKSMEAYDDGTSTDPYFSSNIYAIRELPVMIEVRNPGNGYKQKYFYCDGVQKEVKLVENQNQWDVNQQFYIKIPSAISGIPYLIYSQRAGTPLTVGSYTSNKDVKILMSKENTDISNSLAIWDLLPTSTPGYFAIENTMYFGFGDPNNSWSMFSYVLDVNKNNEIRFAQYNKKSTQEFKIVPVFDFKINDIQFDKSSAVVTDGQTILVESTYDNPSVEEEVYTLQKNNIHVTDKSRFDQIPSMIYFNLSDPGDFNIPTAKAKRIVLPSSARGGSAAYLTSDLIGKSVNFTIQGTAPANSYVEISSYLKTYDIKVNYVATATYSGRTIKFSGTWIGNVVADPQLMKPTNVARYFDYDTGEEITPLVALKYKKSLKVY